MPRLITVAVPVPFLNLLTYQVPDEVEPPVRGARVVAPLGSRVLTGIVVQADAASSSSRAATIKNVIDVLDDEPFLPDAVVDLAMWVAEYYACGAGDAIAVAMPPKAAIQSERHVQIAAPGLAWLEAHASTPASSLKARVLAALSSGRPVSIRALASRMRRDGPDRSDRALPVNAAIRALERDGWASVSQPLRGQSSAHRTMRIATVTAEGLDPQLRLGARQREALSVLSGAHEGLALPALKQRGISPATIERLVAHGLVRLRRERVERDPFTTVQGGTTQASGADRVLTDEQAKAFEQLRALAIAGRFSVSLLHGVTGSGKTEVYLRLADVVRAAGRSVLVLVPEIALTPAVAAAFRATFGDNVAIQHSGLSDGERYDQWQRIRRGEVSIVVGTRSAVFAPLASLGLIVVDEEHDGSFKQEDTPRYHARDVAVMRGKQEGALVLLGSATPSLESYQNARAGRYGRIALERRVFDRPLADVRIVDMQEEYAARGPDVILSEPLKAAITDRVAKREQMLVLLNRRGLARAVFCRQCAGTIECPNCSVSLIVHTEGRGVHRARCHYCNYAIAVPKACPVCAGPYMERIGFGTERVEAEIAAAWPAARVARLDRDTVRTRGAVAATLERVARGEIDVLVGTQMIAKGHDFPRVTLVGVVSADVGLGLADFRAAERTFQLLTQVAGRAGRGAQRGEAIIQTLYPEHYSIRHACRQDYDAFFEDEIRYRRAMRYPPLVALVNAVVRAPTSRAAMADAADLAQRLRKGAGDGHYRVLGPAPAPVGKLRGEYRAQVFLKGVRRAAMRAAVQEALMAQPELRRRVTIDVDPLSVL